MKPPLALNCVKTLWPENPPAAERWSRSLWLTRFADPALADERDHTPRRDFFEAGIGLHADPTRLRSWSHFLHGQLGLPWKDILFAQLQSRLIVNAAGGVMENAGLSLDRYTGQPYIPGAPVKGCARRYALQLLYDMGAGYANEDGSDESPENTALRTVQCAQVLSEIALVFGWTELEWKGRNDCRPSPKPGDSDADFQKRWTNAWLEQRSDFAWACGDKLWESVRDQVAELLVQKLRKQQHPERTFWQQVPSKEGLVQFLPSYPLEIRLEKPLPTHDRVGMLELDLIAAHHREYHAGNPEFADAPDTEDPNLIFFPAVAAGHVFSFVVISQDSALTAAARGWLRQGLEVFGLGAKTASGYGWFLDVSETVAKHLAFQEELAPWRERATEFAALTPVEKEKEALALIGRPDIWGAIADAESVRPLKRYLEPRINNVDEFALLLLLRASAFDTLSEEEQLNLAAELDAPAGRVALQAAIQHFPLSTASANAYLQTLLE